MACGPPAVHPTTSRAIPAEHPQPTIEKMASSAPTAPCLFPFQTQATNPATPTTPASNTSRESSKRPVTRRTVGEETGTLSRLFASATITLHQQNEGGKSRNKSEQESQQCPVAGPPPPIEPAPAETRQDHDHADRQHSRDPLHGQRLLALLIATVRFEVHSSPHAYNEIVLGSDSDASWLTGRV